MGMTTQILAKKYHACGLAPWFCATCSCGPPASLREPGSSKPGPFIR